MDLSQTDRQKEMGESGGLVGALAERDRQKQRDGGLRAAQRKAGEGTVQQQLMQQQQAAMSHATQMHSLMGGPTWLPPGSRGSPSPGPQTNHPMYHSVMTNNYNPGVMDPYLNPNNMQQYIIQQQVRCDIHCAAVDQL